jgi:hypothetical protein
MKDSKISLLAFLLVALVFSFCGKDEISDSDRPIENQIIAELNFENNAWGFQYFNVYFTADGHIYNYENDVLDQEEFVFHRRNEQGLISLNEVIDNINNSELSQMTISQGDIDSILAAIGQIDEEFTDPVGSCIDGGLYTFSAYSYDDVKEEYESITLMECGDWRMINENEHADNILDIMLKYLDLTTSNCCG